MTDHVGIRQVDDREVIAPAANRLDERGGDTGRTHLGLQVVGRHFGGRDQLPVFSLERLLAAAVEEIRHVRVFLGLGGVELLQAPVGEDLGHRRHVLRRERDENIRKVHLVVGQRHEGEVSNDARPRESVEVGLHESPGELSCTVGAKVEEDDAVAVTHRRTVADDMRLKQLVAARGIRVTRTNGLLRAGDSRAVGVDDRPV